MQITYLKTFSKDLDKLKNKQVARKLKKVLLEINDAESINALTSAEKLQGSNNAYRIRIGAYRLGFYQQKGRVEIARFLPRKDIYKYFPK